MRNMKTLAVVVLRNAIDAQEEHAVMMKTMIAVPATKGPLLPRGRENVSEY